MEGGVRSADIEGRRDVQVKGRRDGRVVLRRLESSRAYQHGNRDVEQGTAKGTEGRRQTGTPGVVGCTDGRGVTEGQHGECAEGNSRKACMGASRRGVAWLWPCDAVRCEGCCWAGETKGADADVTTRWRR